MKQSETLLSALWLFHLSIKARATLDADTNIQYYFWNEVTGDVQWEDPGGVPGSLDSCCSRLKHARLKCRHPVCRVVVISVLLRRRPI